MLLSDTPFFPTIPAASHFISHTSSVRSKKQTWHALPDDSTVIICFESSAWKPERIKKSLSFLWYWSLWTSTVSGIVWSTMFLLLSVNASVIEGEETEWISVPEPDTEDVWESDVPVLKVYDLSLVVSVCISGFAICLPVSVVSVWSVLITQNRTIIIQNAAVRVQTGKILRFLIIIPPMRSCLKNGRYFYYIIDLSFRQQMCWYLGVKSEHRFRIVTSVLFIMQFLQFVRRRRCWLIEKIIYAERILFIIANFFRHLCFLLFHLTNLIICSIIEVYIWFRDFYDYRVNRRVDWYFFSEHFGCSVCWGLLWL